MIFRWSFDPTSALRCQKHAGVSRRLWTLVMKNDIFSNLFIYEKLPFFAWLHFSKAPNHSYGFWFHILLSFRRLRCLKAIEGALKPHFVPDIEKGASLLDNFPSKTWFFDQNSFKNVSNYMLKPQGRLCFT